MAVALISALSAAFIGSVAWCEWWLIGLTMFVPLLVGLQVRRALGWTVASAYFGTASWDLIGVYRTFTGQSALMGALAWLIATLTLATPLTLAWSKDRNVSAWRMPLALGSTALPPLGLIGWASPLTAVGVLFPGTAWFGLAVGAFTPSLFLARPRAAVVSLLLASTAAQIAYTESKARPKWQVVNTSFSPARDPHTATELGVADSLQTAILSSGADVIVFPESVVTRWTEATDLFWERTIAAISLNHRFAVLGAGLPTPDSADYSNAALIIGGPRNRAFLQRIPVPIGMWRPFIGGPSVPLRLSGPGTMEVASERVAFLICYEQLLVWPMLQSAIEHPTLIVAMANQHWIRDTNIPAAQRASLRAWSRLFALPLLIAENK
jgi:hypothetical protein